MNQTSIDCELIDMKIKIMMHDMEKIKQAAQRIKNRQK